MLAAIHGATRPFGGVATTSASPADASAPGAWGPRQSPLLDPWVRHWRVRSSARLGFALSSVRLLRFGPLVGGFGDSLSPARARLPSARRRWRATPSRRSPRGREAPPCSAAAGNTARRDDAADLAGRVDDGRRDVAVVRSALGELQRAHRLALARNAASAV